MHTPYIGSAEPVERPYGFFIVFLFNRDDLAISAGVHDEESPVTQSSSLLSRAESTGGIKCGLLERILREFWRQLLNLADNGGHLPDK